MSISSLVNTSIRLALYSADACISSFKPSIGIDLSGISLEKFADNDSLNDFAINGVCEAPDTAIQTSLLYFAIATPTIAYLLAGLGNFYN